jgi:hypothetical protein
MVVTRERQIDDPSLNHYGGDERGRSATKITLVVTREADPSLNHHGSDKRGRSATRITMVVTRERQIRH